MRDHADEPAGFSVADLCRRWRIGPAKVHGFLRRGDLVGINLAANLSGKPQWRITREAVEEFERRRTSAPPPKPQAPGRGGQRPGLELLSVRRMGGCPMRPG